MSSPDVKTQQITCPRCAHQWCPPPHYATPDYTPHAALVLSLDGGGIRGYSTLLILQQLMEEIRDAERTYDDMSEADIEKLLLPCLYFDYIVGTSTGGLIAIMLGRLRMPVDSAIAKYEKFGETIFGKARWFHARTGFFLWDRAKYGVKAFIDIIAEVVQENKENEIEFLSPDGSGSWDTFEQPKPKKGTPVGCKTVAVSTRDNQDSALAFLFRSYDHPVCEAGHSIALNPGPASRRPIMTVARATSAAPGYFPEVRLEDGSRYMDGAILANNPVGLAGNEAWQMAKLEDPHVKASHAIGCMVSIGTGRSLWQIFGRDGMPPLAKYFHMLFAQSKIVTDTEAAHKNFDVWASSHFIPYHRYNVQEGLERMKMDEWKEKKRQLSGDDRKMTTLEYLRFVTDAYINGRKNTLKGDGPKGDGPEVDVRQNLHDCAVRLVKYRRARKSLQTISESGGNSTGSSNERQGDGRSVPNGDIS